MLTISKVFTIICLLCLCENWEYPSSFQNKSVSSSFKWVPKYIRLLAKLKGEGKPFRSGQAHIYLLNYLLHVGVKLTIIKVFIILFLHSLWKYGLPWQFSKKINNLFFQFGLKVYSLLVQIEKKRGRPFLEGAR